MKFNKNKYLTIKNIIDNKLCSFLFKYFKLKKQVFYTLKRKNYNVDILGNDGDNMLSNTFGTYSDIAFETLLEEIKPILEKNTKLKLSPNYTYARIYKNGDVLKKHKDRFSCEISATLNLGGETWPIYLQNKNKKIKVILNPGDLLIYKGCELYHWRDEFEGNICGQVFLHYNNMNTKGWENNKYDTRPHLGYPFKND